MRPGRQRPPLWPRWDTPNAVIDHGGSSSDSLLEETGGEMSNVTLGVAKVLSPRLTIYAGPGSNLDSASFTPELS